MVVVWLATDHPTYSTLTLLKGSFWQQKTPIFHFNSEETVPSFDDINSFKATRVKCLICCSALLRTPAWFLLVIPFLSHPIVSFLFLIISGHKSCLIFIELFVGAGERKDVCKFPLRISSTFVVPFFLNSINIANAGRQWS